MADLASLMKVAPISGGMMVGRQFDQEQQSEALRQQELQHKIAEMLQTMEQNKQMNPLLVEKAQLANQLARQGTIPQALQTLRENTMKNDESLATQTSRIASTNAANEEAVAKAGVAGSDRFTNFLMGLAPELEGIPPAMRMNYVTNAMQQAKFDPQSPQAQAWLQRLAQQDAATWPEAFTKMAAARGQQAANQNPAYLSHIQGVKEQAASHERVAKGNNATSIRVAEIGVEGRKAAAAAKAATASPDFWTSYYKIRGARNQYAALNAHIAKLGDSPEADVLRGMAEAIKPQAQAEIAAANARPGTPNVDEMGVPSNPPLDIAPPAKTSGGAQVAPPKIGQTKSGVKFKIIPN